MEVKISPVGAKGKEQFMLEAVEGGYIASTGRVTFIFDSAKLFANEDDVQTFVKEHHLEVVS